MIVSGITLADGVLNAMYDVRMKRTRYAVFTVRDDGTKIDVSEVGPREATYDEFIKKMNTNEPCYIAFDYEYTNGNVFSKLLLIQWIPDSAKPRIKMLYSSSFDAFSAVSEGYMRVQVNEVSALERTEMMNYIKLHSSAKH